MGDLGSTLSKTRIWLVQSGKNCQQIALADVWHLKGCFKHTKNNEDGHHEDEPDEKVFTVVHDNRLLLLWIWSCSTVDRKQWVATYRSVMSSDVLIKIYCFGWFHLIFKTTSNWLQKLVDHTIYQKYYFYQWFTWVVEPRLEEEWPVLKASTASLSWKRSDQLCPKQQCFGNGHRSEKSRMLGISEPKNHNSLQNLASYGSWWVR